VKLVEIFMTSPHMKWLVFGIGYRCELSKLNIDAMSPPCCHSTQHIQYVYQTRLFIEDITTWKLRNWMLTVPPSWCLWPPLQLRYC